MQEKLQETKVIDNSSQALAIMQAWLLTEGSTRTSDKCYVKKAEKESSEGKLIQAASLSKQWGKAERLAWTTHKWRLPTQSMPCPSP